MNQVNKQYISFRIAFFITSLSLLFACAGEAADKGDTTKDANAYMHQSDFDALVERFEGPERNAYQQPEKVMEWLGDIRGKKIMDIGAGTGYFSFRLAAGGAQVLAADVDTLFQQYILNKRDSLGIDAAALDTMLLPYDSPRLPGNSVDMVLVVNTYHHIANRKEYFADVLMGLRQDGELVIIDYFKKDIPVGPPAAHKIDYPVVVQELKSSGFTHFAIDTTLLEYQYCIRASI